MKISRILFVAALFSLILPSLACTSVREETQAPPAQQSLTPSLIPSASPVPFTPTSTPLPSPMGTPSPSPTLRPTITSAPFLPAGLAIISPQNASELQQIAIFQENGAGVVAYSPDSRRFAAGLFHSNQVKLWDLTNGQELLALGGHVDPRIISYLAFSPDGAKLVSGAQGWEAPNDSLIVWDVRTGGELQRFNGVLGAISPDFKMLALTRRETEQEVTLVLSGLVSGIELHTLSAPGDIYAVSFSPQSQLVAAKMYNVFQDLFAFWSVESGRLERTQYDWVGFSFSPDGRFIAALLDTGSGSDVGALNIFDATTFKWIKTLSKDADSLWYTYPAFSPDGQVLAASTGDHITLWDTTSWKVLVSLPASGPTGFAFSPDGRIMTTFTLSGPIQLFGVVEGQ